MPPSATLEAAGGSLPEVEDESPLLPRKPDFSFKITTLGKSGVGKTCLSLRYTEDTFTTLTPFTCGLDFSWRTIRLGGKDILIRVMDTAGQDTFRTIIKQYPRDSDGVILAYDVTEPKSFQEIPGWLEFARNNGAEGAIKILVGCKSDLKEERRVSPRQGKELAQSLGLYFIETSAKAAENVETAFRTLAYEILERKMGDESEIPTVSNPSPERIRLGQNPNSANHTPSSCCI